MSVFYRAIWNDDRPALTDGAMADFAAWVKDKSGGAIEVPDQGTVAGSVRSRSEFHEVEARVERAVGSADSVVVDVRRAAYVEMRPDGSRWTTTMRAWTCRDAEDEERQEGAGWLWVDVEAVSDGPLDPAVAAPRLVPALLGSGTDPRRRCMPLGAEPVAYRGAAGAERLAEFLGHTDRDIPVVVFSPLQCATPAGMPTWDEIVARAARSLSGMASIATVDEDAARGLESILGRPYGVRPGAMRVYLPGLDPAMSRDDWRHREFPWTRIERQVATAANLLTRTLGPRAASRRAPRSYDAARDLIEDGQRRDDPSLLDRLHQAETESRQQRERLAAADDKYVDLLIEFSDLQSDSAQLRDQIASALSERDSMHGVLRRHNLVDTYWTERANAPEERPVPSQASSPRYAALLAQEHLSDHLALPEAACVDLDDLDAAVESGAWGQTAWEGFRALHAYAEQSSAGRASGSFWTWCEKSRHPLAWRATPKKLALSESESLKANKRLWAKRLFPVSKEVDPTGKIHMEAHLKIAEGGGPLAPRIYFHYASNTHKVHVGFFGPHKHTPNSLA